MNFKKYAILSMGLWVLGFGVYESRPAIAHADEQITTSKQVKTTLSGGTNAYWYDGSAKLPIVVGDSASNKVVAHFTDGQSDIGEKDVTITVDPAKNTSYNFGNAVDADGLIYLQGKVIVGDVKVKYVDTDGNEIAASTEATHSDDPASSNYLNYTTKQLDINGYTFVKMDETSLPANGTLSGIGGTVIYVYKANKAESESGNSNPNNSGSVANAANSEVTTTESSDASRAAGSNIQESVSDYDDSSDSNQTSDSTSLLNTDSSNSGTQQTQQSGLLPSTSTTSSPNTATTASKSAVNNPSQTTGLTAEDQGVLPQTGSGRLNFYITIASFSLVSLMGLVGIFIIKH